MPPLVAFGRVASQWSLLTHTSFLLLSPYNAFHAPRKLIFIPPNMTTSRILMQKINMLTLAFSHSHLDNPFAKHRKLLVYFKMKFVHFTVDTVLKRSRLFPKMHYFNAFLIFLYSLSRSAIVEVRRGGLQFRPTGGHTNLFKVSSLYLLFSSFKIT